MKKIYEPDFGISFIIYEDNGKKQTLVEAVGNTDDIIAYCQRNKIRFSTIKSSIVDGITYVSNSVK